MITPFFMHRVVFAVLRVSIDLLLQICNHVCRGLIQEMPIGHGDDEHRDKH